MSEIPVSPKVIESIEEPSSAESLPLPEIVIAGQELVDIFQSNTFRTAIHFLSAQRRKHGQEYEGGFNIFRDPQTRDFSLIYTKDTEAKSTGVGEAEKEEWKQLVRGRFSLIDLHYHPYLLDNPLETFMPSTNDLETLRGKREKADVTTGYIEYDVKPLGVIAIVKDRRNTEMVLYQEATDTIKTRPILQQYNNDLDTCENIPEIFDVLGDYGFKAAQVTYTPQGLLPEHQERLRSFGFVMKPYQRSEYNPNSPGQIA